MAERLQARRRDTIKPPDKGMKKERPNAFGADAAQIAAQLRSSNKRIVRETKEKLLERINDEKMPEAEKKDLIRALVEAKNEEIIKVLMKINKPAGICCNSCMAFQLDKARDWVGPDLRDRLTENIIERTTRMDQKPREILLQSMMKKDEQYQQVMEKTTNEQIPAPTRDMPISETIVPNISALNSVRRNEIAADTTYAETYRHMMVMEIQFKNKDSAVEAPEYLVDAISQRRYRREEYQLQVEINIAGTTSDGVSSMSPPVRINVDQETIHDIDLQDGSASKKRNEPDLGIPSKSTTKLTPMGHDPRKHNLSNMAHNDASNRIKSRTAKTEVKSEIRTRTPTMEKTVFKSKTPHPHNISTMDDRNIVKTHEQEFAFSEQKRKNKPKKTINAIDRKDRNKIKKQKQDKLQVDKLKRERQKQAKERKTKLKKQKMLVKETTMKGQISQKFVLFGNSIEFTIQQKKKSKNIMKTMTDMPPRSKLKKKQWKQDKNRAVKNHSKNIAQKSKSKKGTRQKKKIDDQQTNIREDRRKANTPKTRDRKIMQNMGRKKSGKKDLLKEIRRKHNIVRAIMGGMKRGGRKRRYGNQCRNWRRTVPV